jgi:hypothetical protein
VCEYLLIAQTATQFKRRTILRVDNPFPHLVSRQQIASKAVCILDPLDCVLEDISKRVQKIHSEIHPSGAGAVPRLKTLNQVLSGSVNMQVHGGAKEVCEVFLAEKSPEAARYSDEKLGKLRSALSDFLDVCEEALEVSRALITESDTVFQTVLDEGFAALKKSCEPLLYK